MVRYGGFRREAPAMVDEETLERVMIATIESDNGCFGFDEE